MDILWFVLFLGVLCVGVPALSRWVVGDAAKPAGSNEPPQGRGSNGLERMMCLIWGASLCKSRTEGMFRTESNADANNESLMEFELVGLINRYRQEMGK